MIEMKERKEKEERAPNQSYYEVARAHFSETNTNNKLIS